MPRIKPRSLPAIDEVSPVALVGGCAGQQRNHFWNLAGIVLAIAVEHDDLGSGTDLKASHQRGRFAQSLLESNATHATVGRGG